MCSQGPAAGSRESERFPQIGQFSGFALALYSCQSLGLWPREELGAGKRQWTWRHNDLYLHVRGCQLREGNRAPGGQRMLCLDV